eukprot:scaffold284394_cov61-Attheya_sp.AAC.2
MEHFSSQGCHRGQHSSDFTISGGIQEDVTMQVIVTGILINNKKLEKMHDQRTAVSDDKKKHFNKLLHAVQIRMILSASSEDQSGVVSAAPCKDIQGFYECKTASEAKIHLEHSLSTVYGCILNFSTGFVTALYCGAFIWDCPGKLNNWNDFQFAKPALLTPQAASKKPYPFSKSYQRERMVRHGHCESPRSRTVFCSFC